MATGGVGRGGSLGESHALIPAVLLSPMSMGDAIETRYTTRTYWPTASKTFPSVELSVLAKKLIPVRMLKS